ncbi:MAG: polyprenyl synthetase [Gemmatales bacterium]|nr:MAG: polyprenyl synthetase [Gemmatales bacterium]
MNETISTNPANSRLPLAELYAPIARDLERTEQILLATLSSSRPAVARMLEDLDAYRGKRLRPALLLLTARACGGVNPAHHTLAAVVEMIHTATLVHDDVLDAAVIRRHRPTVSSRWGNQNSILLGDYLFTHAFHLASSIDAQACRIIGQATNRVCEGELEQGTQRGNLALTEEDYLDIIDAKTAELTACCCRLGAHYSDAAGDVVEAMSQFGRYLGIAFQIADDLLDLVGDEETTGKSLGTDIEQQKLTLPVIRLLQHADPKTRAELQQLLSRADVPKRETLGPYFEKNGALAYTRKRADEFAAAARDRLACLPPSSYRDILARLTQLVVYRNR